MDGFGFAFKAEDVVPASRRPSLHCRFATLCRSCWGLPGMLRLIVIVAAATCVGVVNDSIESGLARAAFWFLLVVFGAWLFRLTLRRWERRSKRIFKRSISLGWAWGGRVSAGCAGISMALLLAFGPFGFPVVAGLIALGGVVAGCMARTRHGTSSIPLAVGGLFVCTIAILIAADFSFHAYS